MKFVSTFGPASWDLYAERFIDTWLEYWPGELWLYTEIPPPKEFPDRVTVKSLFEDTDCAKYLEVINPWPVMKGQVGKKKYYQWDLFKFCRKFFAQYDMWQNCAGEPFFWLDADIVTFDKVPEDKLEGFLDNVAMCYLGRKGWHSCASFIGWNPNHEDCKKYFETLRHLYLSGDIFHLAEWHDSFVNDIVRTQAHISCRDIADGVEAQEGTPYNVYNLTELGHFSKHLKGNLKFQEDS